MTGVRAGAGGTGLRSGSQGTGVSGASPLAPITPTGLAVAVVSPTALTVSWDDVPDETSYELEVSVAGGSYAAAVGSPYAANVVSVPFTGLVVTTLYCYRVRATNLFGSSPWSTPVCQLTPSGTENVLVELNSAPVGSYAAPFTVAMASVADTLTPIVPNPIVQIAHTETINPSDVANATVVDALVVAPLTVTDIAHTETINPSDVAVATVADTLTTPVAVPAAKYVNSWATATAGSAPSAMTIPGGAAAGDVLVLIVGRGSNLSAVLDCVGSVQGTLTPFLTQNTGTGPALAAFTTIWDGVETFTGEHTSAVGQQGIRVIHAFRDAVVPTTGESSAIFGGTPAGWDSTSGTVRTFPARTVTANIELLIIARGLSVTGTSWSGGVTATAGGNSTNGNGAHVGTAVILGPKTSIRGVFAGSSVTNMGGMTITIPVAP